MKIFNFFLKKRILKKTCEICSHFYEERFHLDYANGGYLNFKKAKCEIKGDIKQCSNGNVDKKYFDETEIYQNALFEEAKDCPNFIYKK